MKNRISLPKAVTLVALLMFAMTLLVTSTFSWYPRAEVNSEDTYQTLRYVQTGKVTGWGLKTVKTYLGTSENGNVSYSDTELVANTNIPVNDEKIYYFKTVITETENNGVSAISLYLDKIKASGSSISVGLTSPEKTYEKVSLTSGSVSDYCLEDNIIIQTNGTVEIYWFINYSGTIALQLGNFYYMHN